MSNQDPDGRTAFPYNFQALKDAFLWLLQAADLSPIQFRGDCTWSSLGLIFTALLCPGPTKRPSRTDSPQPGRFASSFGKVGPGTGSRRRARRVVSGFHEDVADLDGQSGAPLDGGVSGTPRSTLPDRLTIAGFEVFAVDGSRLEVPRTKSNESPFSPRSARSGGVPRARNGQARLASRPDGALPC